MGMFGEISYFWFALIVCSMFAAAMNPKALQVTIIYAAGLIIVYPQEPYAFGLMYMYLLAWIIAGVRP